MTASIDELLARLESGTEEEKTKALQWLAYQMDPADGPRVLGAVRRCTADASPAVRYHARLALDEIGRRAGAPPAAPPATEADLLSLLAHEAPEVRLKGVLGCYRGERSEALFDRLMDLLRGESDAWVRASLVKAVAGYRRRLSLPLLVRHLRDPDGRVRANTVEALAEMDNPVVMSWIAEMVDDTEHRVQSAVLAALGRDSAGDIRPRIEGMLNSGRVWLVASAVYVIQETLPGWGYEVLEKLWLKGVVDRRLRERIRNLLFVLGRLHREQAGDEGPIRDGRVVTPIPMPPGLEDTQPPAEGRTRLLDSGEDTEEKTRG